MNINKLINSWDNKNRPPIFRYVLIGLGILVFFVGSFLLWSTLTTLESASVATGQVIAETKNKTIEHLEGGIIKSIHAKDGQIVAKGQVLIKLEDTKAIADVDVLKKLYLSLIAEEAMLTSMRDNKTTITWPKEMEDEQKLKQIQTNILQATNQSIQSQLKILNKQIDQLKKEIESYQAQLESEKKQLVLINEELKMVEYLHKKKLIEKPKLLELQRKAAEIAGNQGQYIGLIAKAEQKIGETEQRIISIKDEQRHKVLETMKEVRNKITEVEPKLRAATDTLQRTVIKAPIDGVIIGLTEHTVGGVINPGQSLMTIFPSKDKLIAEANVDPNDIDLIQVGLKARVYLSALKQRNAPALNGEVIHVSADIFKDEQNRTLYYKAKIRIDDEELKKLNGIELHPGMQLRVMIITKKRTPMDYFLAPLNDSFTKAFREN